MQSFKSVSRALVLVGLLLLSAVAALAAPAVNSKSIYWKVLSGQGTALTVQQQTSTANTKVLDLLDNSAGSIFSVSREGHTAVGGALTSKRTAATLTTAGPETLTAAQFLGGLILRDPNGAGRADTTPTAAQLVAALPNAGVGATFFLIIRNTADAAETITLTAGTGVTISGTATIAQNNTKLFLVRLDNVTSSSEAATIYSLGTFVH